MDGPVEQWRREPGVGKYCRAERERRFLVVGATPSTREPRYVEDHYVTGTSLRLRRVTVGDERVHELTQKVRVDVGDPFEVATTTMYLTAWEYELMLALPAADLVKTRRLCEHHGLLFAVDEFAGRLAGLRLAEVEVTDWEQACPRPPWAGREVTGAERYTGASLAHATTEQVRDLLAEARARPGLAGGSSPRGLDIPRTDRGS